MREALENDLRAVLNGALNMHGTVERMLPVAGDVLLRENVERHAEVKALDREVDAQEAQIEAEC
uniref:PhoU domain-containing protein n=1 Tax=Deinococcus sp. GbtcB9 TaxID=2824754 RepID=UPI0034CF7DAA